MPPPSAGETGRSPDGCRKAKVNPKAMTMYEKVEADYGHLAEKKRIVECDRDKIQRVITELDEKKRAALEATWRKVGKDFGSIFSTLLPGTSAKLEPPEDAGSFMDGLEVRVAFGGVWKQSLTELSGGQRSLLALSLILALLLFKVRCIHVSTSRRRLRPGPKARTLLRDCSRRLFTSWTRWTLLST